jgi:hypothetical protein
MEPREGGLRRCKEMITLTNATEWELVAGRRRYRLGPWPELASARTNGSGDWVDSPHAADAVSRAIATALWSGSPDRCWYYLEYPTNPERRRSAPVPTDAGGEAAALYDGWRRFQALIPPDHRVIAKRFASRQISLLRLLSAVPEASDLAQANPALFYLVALHFDRARASAIPREQVLALLGGPRREILALAGLPATEAAHRFLARLPADQISERTVPALAWAVQEPVFGRSLTHLREVPHFLVRVLARPAFWPFLTPSLLREIREHFGRFSAHPEGLLLALAERTAAGREVRVRSAAHLHALLAEAAADAEPGDSQTQGERASGRQSFAPGS